VQEKYDPPSWWVVAPGHAVSAVKGSSHTARSMRFQHFNMMIHVIQARKTI